jgi:hypothetical protein
MADRGAVSGSTVPEAFWRPAAVLVIWFLACGDTPLLAGVTGLPA